MRWPLWQKRSGSGVQDAWALQQVNGRKCRMVTGYSNQNTEVNFVKQLLFDLVVPPRKADQLKLFNAHITEYYANLPVSA